MHEQKKRIVILGAGISGLALGWFLKQRFGSSIDLMIFEGCCRAGGWIQTLEQDGFVFECGPRSCRTSGTGSETVQLIKEIGLEQEVISADPAAYRRYLYINKTLQPLPSNLWSALFSPLTKGLYKAIWRDLWAPQQNGEDESIHAFVSRRLGREVAERFFDPLCAGIYAGDIRQLSIQACFPSLSAWERDYGSLLRGALFAPKNSAKHPIISFKKGMETLTRKLADELRHELRLNAPIKSMVADAHHVVLTPEEGISVKADHVYAAIPAAALSNLIRPEMTPLNDLSSTSVAVVNLGYNTPVLNHQGFGYLIPSGEKEEILGVVWDSAAFPQQNTHSQQTRLTVMIGGVHHPHFDALDASTLKNSAINSLSRQLGITAEPDASHISIARNAIPQYRVGHRAQLGKIEQTLACSRPWLTILGSSYGGVSVNDCIAQARRISSL